MKTNFHIHTSVSDGSFSPIETVRLQKKEGIEALSITDHDRIDGLDEAKAECEKLKIGFVSGIELSCFGKQEVHILGYNIDYKNPKIKAELDEIVKLRQQRIEIAVEKLRELGIDLNFSEEEYAAIKGRMHIAKKMMDCGFVGSINEAFDKYLGSGKAANVAGHRLPALVGVEFVKRYNGIPVLAHPLRFLNDGTLPYMLEGLIPHGLRGLECFYATHNETETAKLLELAKRFKLLATGGTDFHFEGAYINSCYRNDKIDNSVLKAFGLL